MHNLPRWQLSTIQEYCVSLQFSSDSNQSSKFVSRYHPEKFSHEAFVLVTSATSSMIFPKFFTVLESCHPISFLVHKLFKIWSLRNPLIGRWGQLVIFVVSKFILFRLKYPFRIMFLNFNSKEPDLVFTRAAIEYPSISTLLYLEYK